MPDKNKDGLPIEGLIISGVSSFYNVMLCDGRIIRAKGRGAIKRKGFVIKAGDRVRLIENPGGDGIIEEVLPRFNTFERPAISNVELFGIVFAPENPEPNYITIDKFIISAASSGAETFVILNKADLVDRKKIERISQRFLNAYDVAVVSTLTGEGFDRLRKVISGHVTALTGQSGVGKSSIVNKLIPEADMTVGSTSKKTSHGRHTTRHSEIFSLPTGGMIFDTPGFTSFDLTEVQASELADYYPEIRDIAEACRFNDCRHISEPDCAVRRDVEAGVINSGRYESYVRIYNELKERERMR